MIRLHNEIIYITKQESNYMLAVDKQKIAVLCW
jgi:hypothetical protein